jgi:hypothetical protein
MRDAPVERFDQAQQRRGKLRPEDGRRTRGPTIRVVAPTIATHAFSRGPVWVKGGRAFHLSACVARGRCTSISGRREHDPTANSTFGLLLRHPGGRGRYRARAHRSDLIGPNGAGVRSVQSDLAERVVEVSGSVAEGLSIELWVALRAVVILRVVSAAHEPSRYPL